MNLIEQLGGYERAKRIEKNIYGTGGRLIRYPSKDFDYNDDGGSVCDVELISFKANDLKKSLLEYRRANNIYEVGDKAVFEAHFCDGHEGLGYGEITYCTMDKRVFEIDNYYLISIDEIRHATDAEIKAGRRP